MGKRKERRLAAKIGAGRRVKLDLFADPDGDLGGSSAKDEDGKDVDTKLDRELPYSPSSSGQQRENPLSLLGQYSDDELDDGSNEAATKSDDDKQAKESVGMAFEEGEIVDIEDHSSQKADNLDMEKDSASASASLVTEADVRSSMVNLDGKDHEVNTENQDHVLVASDTKTNGGMNSTWKMVLHEESNHYYYWNIVTGETSWDVPDIIAQGAALTVAGTDMKETAVGDVNAPAAFGVSLDNISAGHGVGYTSEILDMKAMYAQGAMANQSLEVDGSQFVGAFSVAGALPYATSSLGNYSLSAQSNLAAVSCGGHDHGALAREQGAVDLPSHLLKTGEALLERLKLLQGSEDGSAEHCWLSKYMLEIETRLSDIRCLLPYGLSIVPFWMHSERQLSRLENDINTEIGKQNNKFTESYFLAEGKEGNLEVAGEAKLDAKMTKLSPENFVAGAHDVDTSAVAQEAVHDKASDVGIANVQQTFLQDPTLQLLSENKGDKESTEAGQGKQSPYPESQSSEDVDMDIDMEVEDQSPKSNSVADSGGQLIVPSRHLTQPIATMPGPSLTPESEFIIPPPPQEDWIPPPPPDEEIPPPPPDEGIPPPPPDEPPESCPPPPPPPSEPEPVPSIYSEQHHSTYIEPSVDYYGNIITDSLSSSFYGHADGNQIAALAPPAYYAAISNAQPTSVLNPAENAAYYGIQNGAVPLVPVPVPIGSSNFQTASGHPNYDLLPTEKIGKADAVAEASSLSKLFVDPLAPVVKTDISPLTVFSASVASTPVTVSTKEYVSVPSYSATATSVTGTSTSVASSDASAAVSKVQSKAPRMKKPKVSVVSSLMSNKKVSGLVDKWKAVKEELQEEEKEERKTPLDILEKKRQRELEEWRKQQIASGEAKENANFQPLGGDWRERVKRRRAQEEATVVTTLVATDDGTKQPDSSELTRDLPSGWQAYWDDSSRKFYYANSSTSETTWTRPTR